MKFRFDIAANDSVAYKNVGDGSSEVKSDIKCAMLDKSG